MIWQGKLRIVFKTISCILVVVFLWQQVSWAGDLIDTTMSQLNAEQSQTFAPSYLQSQQAISQDLISQKQAIEDFSTVQTQNLAASSQVETSDAVSLDLKGPMGGSLGETVQSSTQSVLADTPSEASSEDGAILSITTESGDIIHYKGNQIDYIEKKEADGFSTIRRIDGLDFVDADNNLLNAEITYPDHTVMIVSNGKTSKITKPDGTIFHYNTDELIERAEYPIIDPATNAVVSYSTVNYSYNVMDTDGQLVTVLTDSEKNTYYDANNKLKRVEFTAGDNQGKVIKYAGGILSEVKDADGTTYVYDGQGAESEYVVKLKTIIDNSGVKYEINNNSITGIDLGDKKISDFEIGDNGKIVKGKIEYYNGTTLQETVLVENGRIKEIVDSNNVRSAYQYDEFTSDGSAVKVTFKIYKDGIEETYTYSRDIETNHVKITSGERTWEYNGAWTLLSFTDSNGTVEQHYGLIAIFPPYYIGSTFTLTDGTVKEYDKNKNLVKTVLQDGTIYEYYDAGSFTGKLQKATLPDGKTAYYEYEVTPDGNLKVYKRVSYDFNSIYQSSYSNNYISSSLNPTLKASFKLDSAKTYSSVYSSAYYYNYNDKNVSLSLSVSSQKPTLRYYYYDYKTKQAVNENKTLDITVNKDVTYNMEYVWTTAGVNIYLYEASKSRPDTPVYTISSSSWNPRFSVGGNNANLILDPSSSGTYTFNKSVSTDYNNPLKSSPIHTATFTFNSTASYKSLYYSVYGNSSTSSDSISLNYYNNTASLRVYHYDYKAGKSTNTSVPLSITFKDNTAYIIQAKVEDNTLKLYIYEKGVTPSNPVYTQDNVSWDPRIYTSINGGEIDVKAYDRLQTYEYNMADDQYKTLPSYVFTSGAPLTFPDGVTDIANNVKPAIDFSLTLPVISSDKPYFDVITYGSDKNITKVVKLDGEEISYYKEGPRKGLPKDVTNSTFYDYNISLSNNITGMSVVRGGVKTIYDKYGKVSQISDSKTGVTLGITDGTVSRIQKDDGTIIEDAHFIDGKLDSAKITKPDGVIAIYKEGVLVEVQQPGGGIFKYDTSGSIVEYVKEGIVYHYSTIEEDGKTFTIASVNDSDIANIKNSEEVVFQKYDAGKNLVQLKLKDGKVLNYSYQKDSSGKVEYIIISDGKVETTYDADNNITQAVILPTKEDPVPTISEYKYGRIRNVYKGSDLIYGYTYEFDDAGKETTVITDVKTGDVKRYRDELLISVTDKDNLVTVYEYNSDKKISRSTVTRSGRLINEYTYTYNNDSTTIIEDIDGVKRTYDRNDKMIYLEESGRTYAYTYSETGEVTQKLAKIKYEDGTIVDYKNGEIYSIIKSDGAILKDIVLSSDNKPITYTIEKDSDKYFVAENIITKRIKQDGTIIEYYPNGWTKSIASPDGNKVTDYNYEFSIVADGIKENIELINGQGLQLVSYSDPQDALLLHLNGDNGSKSAVDSSVGSHPVTFNGDAHLDAGNNKFGASSLALDGNGDYLSIPDSDDWYVGTGDATWDFWVDPDINQTTSLPTIWEQFQDTGNYNAIRLSGGKPYVYFVNNGVSMRLDASITIASNIWSHIALVKQGNQWTFYINGTYAGRLTTSYTPANYMGNLTIGFSGNSADGRYFKGNIDEFRFSKGVARYASNFTPPNSGYNPYNNPGTFTSNPIELNAIELNTISWNEIIPQGTDITTQTRTGDTPNPDSTWSDWSNPLTNPRGSKIASPSAKYIQYKANLTTNDPALTPKLLQDTDGSFVKISYIKNDGASIERINLVERMPVTISGNGINLLQYLGNDWAKFFYGDTKIDIERLNAQVNPSTLQAIGPAIENVFKSKGLIGYFDNNGNLIQLTDKNGVDYQATFSGINSQLKILTSYLTNTLSSSEKKTLDDLQLNNDSIITLKRAGPNYDLGTGIDGDLRVETGQTVTITGTKNYKSIYVGSGSALNINGTAIIKCQGEVKIEGRISADTTGYFGLGGGGFGYTQAEGAGGGYGGHSTSEGGGGRGSAGGGGGSYGTSGTNGGGLGGWGQAGPTYGDAELTTLYMGSGGGSGGTENSAAWPRGGNGGNGGGAIKIVAPTIIISGALSANGGNGTTGPNGTGGGGGSGGSIWLMAENIDIKGTVTSKGGYGANDGGNGGDGRIRIDYGTLTTTTITPTPYARTMSYSTTGAYTSDVIEVNASNFTKISWNEEVELGATDILFDVGVGDTLTPDNTWTWIRGLTDPTGSDINSLPNGKYIQYKATFTANDSLKTPKLILGPDKGIKIEYAVADSNSSAQVNPIKVLLNSMEDRYKYDANGRLAQLATKDGRIIKYTYDGTTMSSATSEKDGIVTRFDYENGMVKKVTYNDGRIATYVYDGTDLSYITVQGGNTTYTYNKDNNLTQVIDDVHPPYIVTYNGTLATMSMAGVGEKITYPIDNTISQTRIISTPIGQEFILGDRSWPSSSWGSSGTYTYSMSSLPSSYDWDYTYLKGTYAASNGILTLDSMSSNNVFNYYSRKNISLGSSYSVEAKIRVVDIQSGHPYAGTIQVGNGTANYNIYLQNDGIEIPGQDGNPVKIYSDDMRQDFYTIRLVVKNNAARIFVKKGQGIWQEIGPVFPFQPTQSLVPHIQFGDMSDASNANSNIQWDYFKYYNSGVTMPYGTAGYVTSKIIKIGSNQPSYLTWNEIASSATDIVFQTRTGLTPSYSSTYWSNWIDVTELSNENGKVTAKTNSTPNKYIQYRAILKSQDGFVTPRLYTNTDGALIKLNYSYLKDFDINAPPSDLPFVNALKFSQPITSPNPLFLDTSTIQSPLTTTIINSYSQDITNRILPGDTIIKTNNIKADILSAITMPDGTVIKYFNDKPISIVKQNSYKIDNIVLEKYNTAIYDYKVENGLLVKYQDTTRDKVVVSFAAVNFQNDTYVFKDNQLVEIKRADGTVVSNPSQDNFSTQVLELLEDAFSPDNLAGDKTYQNQDVSLSFTKDGKVTYIINNKMASVYQRYETGQLELLMDYSYDESGSLILIRLPYARDSIENAISDARQNIAREKTNYLRRLAEQEGLAYQQIRENVAAVRAQINAERERIRPSLYQQVTRSRQRGWWIFSWTEYYTETVEVSEVRNALNQLDEQDRILNEEETKAYADLNTQIKAAADKLSQDERASLNEVAIQEEIFRKQIVEEESTPVILEYYRSILGRDPDDAETKGWLSKVDYHSKINITELKDALTNSAERADQADFVRKIKERIAASLENYLGNGKTAILQSLGLSEKDVVGLDKKEVEAIIAFLGKQNIHFGRSAFVSLESLLKEKDISYTLEDLAFKAIMIDILTGSITAVSDGQLLELSMYSLSKAASLPEYGLTLYNTKLDFVDLTQIFNSSGRVIAHLKNNHYVVVTDISADGKVTYAERNKGKDGYTATVSKKDFEEAWTGYAITKTAPQDASKVISAEKAQRVKGSCLPFIGLLIGLFVQAVVTIAAGVVTAITAVVGAISAILAPIISAIGAVISGIANFMIGIGSQIFTAIKFVGLSLLKGIGSFLGGTLFGSAAGSIAGGASLSSTLTALGTSIGNTVVLTALTYGVSKGLNVLGVSPEITSYITNFITGGVRGLIMGGGNPIGFIIGGLQGLAVQGINDLGRHFGVDPMLTNIISNTAGAFIGVAQGSINGIVLADGKILTGIEALSHTLQTQILPKVGGELVRYGLNEIGKLAGADPRLVSAMASAGASISSSFLTNITAPGSDLITSISRSLNSGIVSIGVGLLDNINPAIGAVLRSTGLMSAVENVLNEAGLFNGVFTILSRIIPTAFNTAGNLVTNLFSGAKTFVELVTESGPLGAANAALNSLFTRQTVEAVVDEGGLEGILSRPSNQVVLPDGRVAQEIVITDSASLFLDGTGELISVKEGGIISTGSFVWTQDNGLRMKEGTVEGNIETGYSIWADIDDGKAKDIAVKDKDGNQAIKVDPENPNGSININSIFNPAASEFTFTIMNALVYFASNYMAKVNTDTVESITQKVNAISAGSLFKDTNKFLYALANGIRNPSNLTAPPQYIINQKKDIFDHSNTTIPADDIFPIVLYKGLTTSLPLNGFFDAIRWLVESQIKYKSELVDKVQNDMYAYFVSHPAKWNRPVAAVGYSGGFMPLVEAASKSLYNVKTLVGLGAPTAYLPGIIPAALLQLLSAVAANNFLAATAVLAGANLGYAANLDQVKDIIKTKIREIVQESNITGKTFPITLSPKTELMVNVWGSEDIFYKELGVAGPRNNFLGKNTYNIEIVGASHFDYIRGIDPNNPNPIWNNTVASFVTDLIIHSENSKKLKDFVDLKIGEKIISQDERGVYVVRLPGY